MDADKDGFNVVEQATMRGFVNVETPGVGDYIHLVPDARNAELRCYRSLSEMGEPNKRVMTVIRYAKFRTYFHQPDNNKQVERWYLTGREASTFLSWLDLFSRSQTHENRHAMVEWYQDSGKSSLEGKNVNEETLTFYFTRSDETRREVQACSSYVHHSNAMAKIYRGAVQ